MPSPLSNDVEYTGICVFKGFIFLLISNIIERTRVDKANFWPHYFRKHKSLYYL